jgi:inner membrane protein
MEPITHMLTGAVVARTGFNKRAAYATFAMVLAAELPDIDMIRLYLGPAAGPLTSFQHHRGITHTFIGIPVEAALVTAGFYLYHRIRKSPPAKARPNWLLLYAGCLLALLTHILLDWTNNYGVRPFFPFNPRWYAGSFIFIFEPILFLILLLPLILPPLFALINSEIGSRKRAFPSPAWSWIAIVLVAALYLLRFNEHSKAIVLAEQNATPDATRFFASPHPTNPFLWSVVTDTPGAYHLSTLNTRTGQADSTHPADTVYKSPTTLPILAAKRTPLGRAYLDWSMYPILTETLDNSDPHHPLTAVTFSDARFMYNVLPTESRTPKASLSGTVLLDMQAAEGNRIIETTFGGRKQN